MDINLFLEKFTTTFSIPLSVFENGTPIISFNTQSFLNELIYQLMEHYFDSEYNVCFLVTEDYLQCGFIRMPESGQLIIIGPAFPYEPTHNQTEKLFKNLKLPLSRKTEVANWFHRLPVMDSKKFRDMLDFMSYTITGSIDEPIRLSYHVPLANPKLKLENPDFNYVDTFTKESEALMLSCIENGRYTELDSIFDSLDTLGNIPNIGPNTIRSLKNAFISSTAIVSRAAVRGGLDYDTALSLSNYYITKVEKLTLFADIQQLIRTMLIDYTRRAANYQSIQTDSATVAAICRYVQANLSEKITAKQISEKLHLNTAYISRHFKQKTGTNLSDYICMQKIKEAQFLLETTELPLSVITQKLAFSSQQYFQTTFKKYTGMTPLEYHRKNIQFCD